MNDREKYSCVCAWRGDGEGCRHITLLGKSYCEDHYAVMYNSYLPEMADYVIERELKIQEN